MHNPNEYDDDAYAAAANDVHRVSGFIDGLWNAGATVEDITGQLNNAISESEIAGAMEVVES